MEVESFGWGGNLNIKNQLVKPQKRGDQILKFQSKRGHAIFDANLLGDLRGNYENIDQFWKYYEENNNQFSHFLIIVSWARCAP